MSRYIDADALIADMQERYCKPCKEKGEDYHEVRCRACWVDDAINDVDGFADNGIDIVRCKECKWLRYCETEDLDLYLDCDKPDGGGIPQNEDWFCADGEREGER